MMMMFLRQVEISELEEQKVQVEQQLKEALTRLQNQQGAGLTAEEQRRSAPCWFAWVLPGQDATVTRFWFCSGCSESGPSWSRTTPERSATWCRS